MTQSEEELAFFHELGIAITQWSFVESELFELVAEHMRDSRRYPFGFGFFGIENFRSKLAFCDEFLIRTMDKAHLPEWRALVKRIKGCASQRNRLAHDRVFVYSKSIAGRRFGLIDWPNDKPRPKSNRPPSDALCVRDIVAVRQGFFRLHLALQNFRATLAGRVVPHPKLHELKENPPTIRALRNRMHEALGRQPKPLRRKSSARPSEAPHDENKDAIN